MTNEEMKAKIAAAAKKQEPKSDNSSGGMQKVSIKDLNGWLGEGYKNQKFDKQILDLKEIFKEKMQFLLFGKPMIIERVEEDADKENEEAHDKLQEEVKKLINQMKLQRVMFANEGDVFTYGRGIVILDKIGDIVTLKLAEPSFPNTITRLGTTPIGADLYVPFMFDRVKYYQRIIYTYDKIETRLYTVNQGVTNPNLNNLKEVKLKKFNKNLPPSLQIRAVQPNPYGFIPAVEVTYKPTYQMDIETKSRLAPFHKLSGMQTMLNEGTKSLRTELYLNKTKIMVDEDTLNANDRQSIGELAEAGIIGVFKDTGGVDGDNKSIEIMQGDPKVTSYGEHITNTISIVSQSLKLSELSEEGADTATGEIFNKGNDVETANTLQVFRQEDIAEIMTKAGALYKNQKMNEIDIDTSEGSIQIIPNVIMNEAKMTEIVQQQLSSGLINMTQALVKLEGISAYEANKRLQQDDGVYNPSLEAVSSFTDDGTNADIKEKESPKQALPKDGKQVIDKK